MASVVEACEEDGPVEDEAGSGIGEDLRIRLACGII